MGSSRLKGPTQANAARLGPASCRNHKGFSATDACSLTALCDFAWMREIAEAGGLKY